jgi:hypothetical protein
MGIFLHARIQHLDNTQENTYYTGLSFANGTFKIGMRGPDSLGASAWSNWLGKHQVALSDMWLRDGEAYHRGEAAFEPGKVGLRRFVADRLQRDGKYWRGWYRRHGGEIELLGDRFTGDAPSVLLALAAMALLWKMAQQAPRLTVAAAGKPRSSRSRHKR